MKEKYSLTGERMYAVLNSTYDGIVAIDTAGRVTLFNAAAERLLGHSAETALGMHVNEVIPGTTLCQVLEDGRPQLGVILEVNGNTLLTNRTPVLRGGEIAGAVAVFENIAGIKELHKTLDDTRTSVEVLETILDSTYDGIVLVDKQGIVTKINRAYLDFLRIKEEDAVGKHVTEVIENTRMHIVVETGKAEIGHAQKIRGSEMVVMRLPIFKNGEVVGAVGKVMFRDLRELKALAENLNLIENELKYYKTELHRLKGAKYTFENIIGNSEQISAAKQLARQAAASDSTVLIYGESGTGKEIFAHAIHNYSYRHFGSFVRVNCGAIPGTLFESELFGYEKGAFTGAQKCGKPGKFELANNGTIFLDEVGEMPLEMQVKLLRVLQEKEIERVGGTKLLPLDVRVIAASNKPLEELVKEKKFREDLFYRLNIFRIELPPLRDIPKDIPLMARHLVAELNESLGTAVYGLSEEVVRIFQKYTWPGNVRELRNVLERTVIVNRHGEIQKNQLPLYLLQNELRLTDDLLQLKKDFPGKLDRVLQDAEKALILKALEMTGNNKRQAAHLLGIHRSALYQKINKYHL
ncbi:MAG: DNA-binding transcriptional activator HyfR [Syntrophomonadaceae bacterium]|nr:DNA-binding transcriptional activator HyfR [Bacillota bacterium]